MTQVYVDMDGVLADFDRHYEEEFGVRPDKKADNVEWDKVRATPNFYADIPPMSDAFALWNFLCSLPGHPPIVLTGVPRGVPEAATNKRAWVNRHLGSRVQMIATQSKKKYLCCSPGDILIDDWEKYRQLWEQAGGRWITHVSAADSIEQLKSMLKEDEK